MALGNSLLSYTGTALSGVGLGLFLLLFWLARFVMLGAILRKRRRLSARCPHSATKPSGMSESPPPRVSVLIAAKDEEENIGPCVESLLEQDYANFKQAGLLELIVVDDRSRDRTAEILADLRNRHKERLRVLTVTSIRDGYTGKTNAMREGMTVATGDWLLFTDADCRFHSPHTISAALREAIANDVDFLSVIPELEVHAIWEKIIQPVCVLVLMMWFRPDRVNDPKRPTAYANGAFMLMRRGCYEAIGGHDVVRGEMNEDIQMARIAKRSGFRLLVVESDGLYRTRMYDTLTEGLAGWSRIFAGALRSPGRVAAAALLVVLFSITPWAGLLVAAAGAFLTPASADMPPFGTAALFTWGASVVMQLVVVVRLYGAIGFGRWWSLTYILGAIATAGVLINALFKAAGIDTVKWRDTTYRRGRVLEDPDRGAPESATDGPSTRNSL